jgi:hypothetical protein
MTDMIDENANTAAELPSMPTPQRAYELHAR